MKRIVAFLFASVCAAQAQTITGGGTSALFLDSSAYSPTMVFGGASDTGKCLGLAIGVVSYQLTPLTCSGGGGGGSPGGSNGMIQYNNAGNFGGVAGATSDGTSLYALGLVFGTVGGTANLSLITPRAGGVPQTVTIPETTGTIGMLNLSQTWTGQNVFNDVVTVNKNTFGPPGALTGTVLVLANADTTATRIELDAYGSNSFFSGRRANGTNALPTTLVANDLITNINGLGYDGSAYTTVSSGSYRIYAAGTWSGSSTPTYLDFYTTATGSTTSAARVRVENSGGVTLPPTVTGGDKGAGTFNATAIYQAGTALGSNAFTSTAYAPAASPTFTGTVTMPDASTWTSSGVAALTGLGLTSAADLVWNSDLHLMRNAAGDLRHGAADSATPVAQIIRMQSGVGTNIAGAKTTIVASLATGSGTSGAIEFDTGPTGTTGTTQATATAAVTINTPAGTVTLPTLAFNACGTNCGWYSAGANKIGLTVAGAKVFDYGDSNANAFTFAGQIFAANISVGGTTRSLTWSGGGTLTGPLSNTIHVGPVDAAAPSAQTLGFVGITAGTSNTAAPTATIKGGLSTGNGGGDLVFQTTQSSAGATTQNSSTTALTLKGGTQLVYTNSATQILGSNTTITGGGTGNVPTLTAGPVNGNPTKWLPYDDNGTTRYIPAW